jgi:queuosine precursor transporter
MLSTYFFNVAYETLATPLNCLVVGWLKHAEQSDVFDTGTEFHPFAAAR